MGQRIASYLSPQQMFLLDLACKPIHEAFGNPPYLVGSVLETADYRDVDVRLMLWDDDFAKYPPQVLTLMAISISCWLKSVTGLPIDFQFQQTTEANKKHDKKRNPLGLRHLSDFRGDAVPVVQETKE